LPHKQQQMEIKIDINSEINSLKEFIREEIRNFINGSASNPNRKQSKTENKDEEPGKFSPMSSNQPPSKVDDLAKRFRVSNLTIYNWIKTNGLKSSKEGRNIMVSEDDLFKFLKKNPRIQKRLTNKGAKKENNKVTKIEAGPNKKAGRPKKG